MGLIELESQGLATPLSNFYLRITDYSLPGFTYFAVVQLITDYGGHVCRIQGGFMPDKYDNLLNNIGFGHFFFDN